MSRENEVAKLKIECALGRLVLITGTGVSVAVCRDQIVDGQRVATWKGLLQHGVQYCRFLGIVEDEEFETLSEDIAKADTDTLIVGAGRISEKLQSLGSGVFRGWLEDTVGQLVVKDRPIIDAVAAIPGVLATLNYDGLIEAATGRGSVTWLRPNDVQNVFGRMERDSVLHLHGWFKEPESVVLDLKSYKTVSDHPHAAAVLKALTIFRTLVFVGCGETVLDPNFSRLIEWGREALKDVAPRHYLLCRTEDLPAFRHKLSIAPWLQPLEYGPAYEDLVPFLRTLPTIAVCDPILPYRQMIEMVAVLMSLTRGDVGSALGLIQKELALSEWTPESVIAALPKIAEILLGLAPSLGPITGSIQVVASTLAGLPGKVAEAGGAAATVVQEAMNSVARTTGDAANALGGSVGWVMGELGKAFQGIGKCFGF
jgi:hypothetical protein